MNNRTDFLYARPSFTEGIARILDFGNTLNEYNDSWLSEETDFRALQSDWEVIGNDMKEAVKLAGEQIHVPPGD
jgi:hypothetical protein